MSPFIYDLIAYPVSHPVHPATLKHLSSDLKAFALFMALGVAHATVMYLFSGQAPVWKVLNFAGELERLLNAGHSVETAPEADRPIREEHFARQLLGLGPRFTRKELDRARRRLAAHLHPDRWWNAPPGVRRTHEEAMKRINSA